MADFLPLAGMDARVLVGNLPEAVPPVLPTEYCFRVVNVQMQATLGDATSILSGGAREVIPGPFQCSITLQGPLDSGNMFFVLNQPYAVYVLYSPTCNYLFNTYCESIRIDADVNEPDSCEIVFQTTGTFNASFPGDFILDPD